MDHPILDHFKNEGHMITPDDIRHQLGASVPASLAPYSKPAQAVPDIVKRIPKKAAQPEEY